MVTQVKGYATKKASKSKALDAGSATAIHANNGESHVVGIGHLRVIVCNEGGLWFAQGLEIDYAADGKSLAEVKRNFEHGLQATIGLHLQAFGSIEKFLTPAPAEIWKDLWKAGKHHKFSQVTVHEDVDAPDALKFLPFTGINYIESDAELAA